MHRSKTIFIIQLTGLIFLVQSAVAGIQGNQSSLIKTLNSEARFSILQQALEKTGLDNVLDGTDSFTLFAPTNKAFETFFEKLGVNSIDELSAAQLEPILRHHVLSGQVKEGKQQTLNKNADLNLETSGGKIRINGNAGVDGAKIETSNGTIYPVDRVLIPDSSKKRSSSNGAC